jgi:hypothetical protein
MGCFLPPNRNKTPHIKQKTCIEPKHYIFLVQSGGSWKNKEGEERRERREGRTKKEDSGLPPKERAGRGMDTMRRERERRRRRPMGHSVLAVGLAVTHGHHLRCRHSPALG